MEKTDPPTAETAVAAPYKPTPRERPIVDAYFDQLKEKPPAPRVAITQKGRVASVATDHPDLAVGHILLANAMGAHDASFYDGLIIQLGSAAGDGTTPNVDDVNFMVSVIKGVAPRDQLETMMAAQMATVHMATMKFAWRLNHVDNLAQQDSAERAYNKLARTFAVQVEALKRYRTGGEQHVTVQHVTVHDGGKATVGAVAAGGGPGG